MHLSRVVGNAGRLSATLLFSFMTLGVARPAHAQSVLPNTTGEQKTAVIMVNFTDDQTQSRTAADVNTLVFGGISEYFWESSYQKTFLSGATFGWFTLPITSSQCSWDAIVQEGNRAATAAGANLGAYKHFIYLFPKNASCANGAGGTTGPNGEHRVFINGDAGIAVPTIAHEMGHAFGLLHSDGLDCDVGPLTGTCTTLGYADASDTMGSDGHFNAFQKERLGWLNVAGAPSITTVSSSGRYAIEPYETNHVGPKALKILRSTDPVTGQKTWFYVEYRQPIGYDRILAGRGNLTTGVQVRTGTIGSNYVATSLALDMTPNSSSWIGVDFIDGALDAGKSFTDAASGITISLVAADASGATIDVSLGSAQAPTCARAAPTLSLTGANTAVAAGSAVSYSISLSNKDSAACTATTFSLAKSLPAGWSGALATASLSLSPGASGTTTLSVTSPSGASAGGYDVGVGASSAAGAVHTANASSVYTVAAGGTLSDAVGTDKTSYLRGERVYMSAMVRSNGVPASGAAVKLTVTLPSGAVAVMNATSGSDGYARSSYRLGKAKNAVGHYTLRADASLAGSSASSSSAFSVR